MSTAPHRLPTEAEYLAWEETQEQRHEYHHGEIYAMAGGTASHSQIILQLAANFVNAQTKTSCVSFSSDMKINSKPGEYKYADLSIVNGTPRYGDSKQTVLLNPTVIIEVLSPSSEVYDRTNKFESYKAIASFEHYLLVRQDWPVIEYYQKLPDGRWAIDVIKGLDQVVQLPVCGIKIPLQTVYQFIQFPEHDPREATQLNVYPTPQPE